MDPLTAAPFLMRLSPLLLLAGVAGALHVARAPPRRSTPHAPAASRIAAAIDAPATPDRRTEDVADKIGADSPLRVIIAGAGVGGLALANQLEAWGGTVDYTVIEKTSEFKRFGGPIQLASNAMRSFRELDAQLYDEIEAHATWTGNRTNGIKDGVRDEWYAKFDLKTPAQVRSMPYTCVVDRPDLQAALLKRVQPNVRNGAAVTSYTRGPRGVTATLDDGSTVEGDVLVGADGIWSAVRATMREQPVRGDGSGVTYSGYTVFAGELEYGGQDAEYGYTVYIGPKQYFVITDIGRGRYQWYAFLSRPPDSAASEPKPEGSSPYLQNLFEGWSPDVHRILKATKEHEIEQRDLYDRPPSVLQPWYDDDGAVLLGDSVHAMMPNLGQGGCQAIEDAAVLSEELLALRYRADLPGALDRYRSRRLARSAAVQGLSRFASDIIIQGFDTPAKIVRDPDGGPLSLRFENFNYAGIVTRLLQPVLPVFFSVQFNFLYSGWRNEPFALEPVKDFFVLAPAVLSGGLLLDAVLGGELLESATAAFGSQISDITELLGRYGAMFFGHLF